MTRTRLILASASPRRLELLRQVGLQPEVVTTGVDELRWPGEHPRDLVLRLAEAKARAAGAEVFSDAPAVVIAADTAVVVDHRVLGKPTDDEQAERMLRLLRGRTHEVLTGVFLLRLDDGRSAGGVEITQVRFRDYDDATLRAYIRGGEPVDKAGAYGIQGRGALLGEGIVGSWSNVVGLPVERLPGWFEMLGLELSTSVDWST